MKRISLAILAPALCLAIFSCEDTITPMIQEEVRLAALPDRTLLILAPSNGTSLPSGNQTVKDGEPLDISATPNSGFVFVNWTQTAGAGTAAFEDATAATTRVRVTGGDATIQAVISDTTRQLTVQNDGHGTTVPSGIVTVGNGLQRNIQAIPDDAGGYQFLNWTKASGEGTVLFGDANAASTTVTLSSGDATIRANFTLKQYTITLTTDGHGTTTPNGTLTLSHGIASGNLSTTPSAGYHFLNWTVTAGSGVTFSPNATTSTATITASGGNATVQANFELIPYTLTISAGAGGWVSPSGARTVTHGVPFQLHAYPYGTYKFVNWTKTSVTGTVVFSSATDPAATATVTTGDVTITANFTKESLALSEVGSKDFKDFTTYPNNGKDIYFYNNYFYVLGEGTAGNSVVRRFSVGTPNAPDTTDATDYKYITGAAAALEGDGTYLFAATNTATTSVINRMNISSFGPSATLSFYNLTNASYGDFMDLYIEPGSSYLWGCTEQNLFATSKTFGGDYYLIDDTTGLFSSVIKTSITLLGIRNIDWAADLSSYDVDGTSGATYFSAPTSSVLAHHGDEDNPGSSGRISAHPDGEMVALPIHDLLAGVGHPTNAVKIFGTDDPSGIYLRGEAALTNEPKQVIFDDLYIYVAASSGTQAYIYVIDAYNPASPVLKTTYTVTGFGWVDAVYVNGNYLYAVVDTTTTKPTLKVFQIVRS